jgi:hypothetical protein
LADGLTDWPMDWQMMGFPAVDPYIPSKRIQTLYI